MGNMDGAVFVKVSTDGVPVRDSEQLVSVDVQSEMTGNARATLRYVDGDPAIQTFQLTDQRTFEVGAEIEIGAGYNSNDPWTLFKGRVIAQRIIIGMDGDTYLEVICEDQPISPAVGQALSQPVITRTFGEDIYHLAATIRQSRNEGKAPPSGTVSFQGTGEIRAGQTMGLAGGGKVFEGPVLVFGLTHQISRGNWVTEAQFGAPQSDN